MIARRHFLATALVMPAALSLGGFARAAQPETYAAAGIAINGYDPVAYFTQGRPVPGDAARGLLRDGAMWHFASAEHRALFEADPESYAPRFGGYCAYAVSRGYTAPTVPEAWHIHEDRLYLNFSLRARDLWRRDIPGNIAKGEANWPAVLSG